MKWLRNSRGVRSLWAGLLLLGVAANTCNADLSGWIAFGSTQDGDWDIWAVRSDGTGLRQLTNSPGEEATASWSPDSGRIVYSHNSMPYGTETQLWVYDWFTETSTKLYDAHNYQGHDNGSFLVMSPMWSPDGDRILFREDAAYLDTHIAVINANGTGYHVLPIGGYVDDLAWSPSGTAFVYQRRTSGTATDLWIYDFTQTGDILNGTSHQLTQGASGESTTKYAPDWDPTGRIALSWGHNLALIDPGNSPAWGDPASPDVTFLTSGASWPNVAFRDPAWSLDGSHLVYYHQLADGQSDLWLMDLSATWPLAVLPGTEMQPDWGNPGNPIPAPTAALLCCIGVSVVGLLRRHTTS